LILLLLLSLQALPSATALPSVPALIRRVPVLFFVPSAPALSMLFRAPRPSTVGHPTAVKAGGS